MTAKTLRAEETAILNRVERLQMRAGGYHPAVAAHFTLTELEPILKQGTSVLWASVVTGCTWGLAGWGLSDGNGGIVRLAAIGAGFALGSSLVFTFDSGFLYSSDTAYRPKLSRLLGYGAIRATMILCISSFTASYTIPLVLGGDLETEKQAVIDRNHIARNAALRESVGLDAMQSRLGRTDDQITALRAASEKVPPDMQHRLDRAKACQADAVNQRIKLREQGVSETDNKLQLAAVFARCREQMNVSVNERKAYFNETRKRLDEVGQIQQQQAQSLLSSTNEVETQVRSARTVDDRHLGSNSQKVLWSLLLSNPAAFVKWAVFSLILLLCEMMPLLQKMQSGQSIPGRTLAALRKEAESRAEESAIDAERKAVCAQAIQELDRQAWNAAQNDPAVLQERKAQRIKCLKAQEIAQTYLETIRDIATRDEDMSQLAVKHARRQREIEQLRDRAWNDVQTALTT